MIKKFNISNKRYYLSLVIKIIWGIYSICFYKFYTEEYFYIDKTETIFIQILTLLKSSWLLSMEFFIAYFILFSCSALLVFLYKKLFFWLDLVLAAILLFNIYCLVFIVLSVLSLSIIYASYLTSRVLLSNDKNNFYENEEVIETIGPYKSEEELAYQITRQIEYYQQRNHLGTEAEIYKDSSNDFYADIYVVKNKKFF